MIYKMQFRKGGLYGWTDFFYPGDERYSLSDIKISLSVEDAGCIEFVMYPNHPNYSDLQIRSSRVRVIRDIGWLQTYIIDAEIREITTNIDGSKTVYAVGILGNLKEVVLAPMSYPATITRLDFCKSLINRYNALVTTRQEIRFSAIRGVDWQLPVSASAFTTDYATVYDTFNEYILKPLNLYLKYENGLLVASPLDLFNHTAPTKKIRIGQNLMSCVETIDGNDIVTSVLPLGSKSSNGTRLDIRSVNNNSYYLTNDVGMALYGQSCKLLTYDNITSASDLKTIAQAELDRLAEPNVTLQLNMLDLIDLGINDEPIDIGDKVAVTLQPLLLNRNMVCTQAEIYPLAINKNRYIFGIRRRSK